MEDDSFADHETDVRRQESWQAQRKRQAHQQTNHDIPLTESWQPSQSPLPRTQGGPPNTQTGSDHSSLPARLYRTSLDESQSHGPNATRTAQKRSSDETGNVIYPPSKQQLTEASRTLSRQGSYQRSPTYHSVASPLPGTPQVVSPHGRHVSSPTVRTAVTTTIAPSIASPSSDGPTAEPPFIKQPTTRPISEQQLINEVKGIYAGLVMVEKKCVEIVTQQSQSTKRLENPQWKALVALHRTLLQEHHDFFSASQHPTASDALKRLAIKYAMPARMWRHGIHAFLELLRHRLPDSMEHMLSFIYLSYSMMALLKESVPSFVETWIECLGDLARYRMAIEDSDPRDREIWSNVARMWYNEAADKSPNVGRIQHHLAVLARPNITEQLFFYTKALTSVVPFVNARESIMLLFDMFVKNNEAMQARYLVTESSLVHSSAILFTRGSTTQFYAVYGQFTSTFSGHMDRSGAKLKIQGPQIAMSLFAGMADFGKDDSRPHVMYQQHTETLATRKQKLVEDGAYTTAAELEIKSTIQKEYFASLTPESQVERVSEPPPANPDRAIASSDEVISLAGMIFQEAISMVASRIGDKNIIPLMHAVLASLWGWSFVPGALVFIEDKVPWKMIATFLNTLGRSGISYTNVEADEFPPSFGGFGRQLPEDFLLRGFIMTSHYYPPTFWTGQLVDEDERLVELPSHQAPRAERCLWLGIRLTTLGRYLTYDYVSKQYVCTKLAESLCV